MKKKPSAYNPAKIEKKWQGAWATKGTYKTKEDSKKDKYYVLDMFPYPSGEGLHVGHPKGYIATDVVSRYRRMKGYSVLHPMGFDAFGLPAENYAIKTKTNPVIAVQKNVARYKKQLEILGLDYDWTREVNTTDPNYYRWTQWIFLQLYKKGLAYESNEPVNWCPKDKTVLANEDIENGRCERCGTLVEKKLLRQWVLKITDYADRMLTDLDAFDETDMPHLVDKKNPPVKGKKTVARRTVHAIVIDPKTKKALCIKWKKFPWTGFPIGGVEAGENVVEAARREVHEETGYKNLKFVRILGGIVKGEYFAAHKNENRVAYSSAVLFELENEDRDEVSVEEVAKHEPVWLDPATLNHDNFTCAELDVWKERLDADVEWDPVTGVPCFLDRSQTSAIKDGVPFVERNAIAAIVKHWKEDKYIGIKWKKTDWRSLITGGPEGSQSLVEGAIQEIIEETGYLHPKFKRKLGLVNAKFFHPPKNINRFAHFNAFYFELADGDRQALTPEDEANHDIVWLTKNEMSEFLTPASQRHIWNTLFLGKPNKVFMPTKPLLDWPESIKEAQRNWIGRSEGALIKFEIRNSIRQLANETNSKSEIEVFTTRPDTLFGVTYVVLAPESKLVKELLVSVENRADVETYIEKAKKESEIERTDATKEKTGIELKGVKAVNPANKEEVPVWVSDYVLADYGTGAVMAVPAHDERDWEFANKFNLPYRQVIENQQGKTTLPYTKDGIVINSIEWLDGLLSQDARLEVVEELEHSGSAQAKVTYKLRDWVFSRQRYWGEPIPMVHCARCAFKKFEKQAKMTVSIFDAKIWKSLEKDPKTLDILDAAVSAGDIIRALNRKTAHEMLLRLKSKTNKGNIWNVEAVTIPVPVAEKNLPVKLPPVKSYEPTGTGESPLAAISTWVNTKCPKCGGPAKRETNTMPQWAGSSWYYLRFEDPKNKTKLVSAKADKYWSPVDLYVGGAEHATRHLIYARFWHKFLHDMKVVSTTEPFRKLQNVGLIMGEDGRKMSKRFGNVVNPDEIVKTFGADTLRVYEMFMGPFDQSITWNTSSIVGPRRFIERVWGLFGKVAKENATERPLGLSVGDSAESSLAEGERGAAEASADGVSRSAFSVATVMNKTIKKVTDDIENLHFNTAISTLMIAVNEIEKAESVSQADYETLLKLFAPFAPHVAEELWTMLGNKTSIHVAPWPLHDPNVVDESDVTIVVQVNGKMRGSFKAPRDIVKDDMENKAKGLPEIGKWLEGKEVRKTVVIPGKLVNFVL